MSSNIMQAQDLVVRVKSSLSEAGGDNVRDWTTIEGSSFNAGGKFGRFRLKLPMTKTLLASQLGLDAASDEWVIRLCGFQYTERQGEYVQYELDVPSRAALSQMKGPIDPENPDRTVGIYPEQPVSFQIGEVTTDILALRQITRRTKTEEDVLAMQAADQEIQDRIAKKLGQPPTVVMPVIPTIAPPVPKAKKPKKAGIDLGKLRE